VTPLCVQCSVTIEELVCTSSLHSTVIECAGPGALTPSGPVRGPMGGPQAGGHYSQHQPQQPYGQQQHRPQQPGQQQQHQQQQQGQYGQQPEEGGGWTGGIKNLFGKVFVVCDSYCTVCFTVESCTSVVHCVRASLADIALPSLPIYAFSVVVTAEAMHLLLSETCCKAVLYDV
jgi:hypothetical protein